MTQVLDREILDGRVVLNGTWEQFKLIQKGSEDSPGVKLSFFAGAIEIIRPGFQHENFSEIIGYLVTTFLLTQGIRFYPSGSMTQEKTGEVSTQADKSFCLGKPKSIPDLSIEVVYTSGGLSKLPKYRALGVYSDRARYPQLCHRRDGNGNRAQNGGKLSLGRSAFSSPRHHPRRDMRSHLPNSSSNKPDRAN